MSDTTYVPTTRRAAQRRQPPFANRAIPLVPQFFAPVVHLDDWQAAKADPRPSVLCPPGIAATSFNWRALATATRLINGHRHVIVEAHEASIERIRELAAVLMASSFDRVLVLTDDQTGDRFALAVLDAPKEAPHGKAA